jgi:hypothetical protein
MRQYCEHNNVASHCMECAKDWLNLNYYPQTAVAHKPADEWLRPFERCPPMIPVTAHLPQPDVTVLCWDEAREFTIGSWTAREDVEAGRCWTINGSSGVIGTIAEARPPSHWQPLPTDGS